MGLLSPDKRSFFFKVSERFFVSKCFERLEMLRGIFLLGITMMYFWTFRYEISVSNYVEESLLYCNNQPFQLIHPNIWSNPLQCCLDGIDE